MKFSPIVFIINIIVLVLAVLIVIPSLDVTLFGYKLENSGLDFSDICLQSSEDEETGEVLKSKCLPNFHFLNTNDFDKRNLIKFEFIELNNSDKPQEEKEEIYNRNVDIIKQRIKSIGMGDMSLQKVKKDGKYFLEVYYYENESGIEILDMISRRGEVLIFEDNPNYEKPEAEEAADSGFNQLEGKQQSETLSIDDVVRVSKFLYSNSNVKSSYYVVRLDFGNANTEKVMQAAEVSMNAERKIPGITLVQNNIPVGFQAAPITPRSESYAGQSYILFTVRDSQNREHIKALESIIKTEAIDTTIQIVNIMNLSPRFESNTIELVKLAIPISFVLFAITAFILFKKQGIVLSLLLTSQALVFWALTQVMSVNFDLGLDVGLLLGYLGSLVVSILLYKTLFIQNLTNQKINDIYKNIKHKFWTFLIMTFTISILFVIFGIDDVLLAPFRGFVVMMCLLIYTLEVSMKAVIPLVIKQE
ncbi:hypothetical protein GF362_07165 [Candidatus Dojkabacteria bacterium]|nr:hypothetical protein [Candidatus Dojkabacteria bacterium]